MGRGMAIISSKNRQDLSRNIPSEVKRQVRQRDGAGCVKCGSFFYHYDHLGVEFKDADVHDPDKIVLLCGGCHDKKNRGFLSTETIEEAARNPICKRKGFSWGALDLGGAHPVVTFGTILARNAKTILKIEGEDVFSILPPVEDGEPFRISANLYDSNGNLIVRIVENQVEVLEVSWDAEVVGQRINIRSGLGVFEAILRVEPPCGIVVERLNMHYKGYVVQCHEGKATTVYHNGSVMTAQSVEIDGGVVLTITRDGLGVGGGGGTMIIRGLEMGPATPAEIARLKVGPQRKIGRNEPCPCQSGKKYKRCHGAIE